MSRHEGVTCDVCRKTNFRGKRFKCLICFDFDLCANCFDNGSSSGNHSTDHPMQCILTRADFDLFFGGENLSYERAQSFTCPMCGMMGLSDRRLQEHVVAEHGNSSKEVICPLCAAMPGGDPNMMTDSLVAHLALEHRARQHDYDDTPMRHMRRMYQASRLAGVSGSSSASAHRSSPFSLRSRAQPQAVFSNGSSNPSAPGASSFLSSLVSSAPSAASTSAGPSIAGGHLVQDSLSQDLVELITQMSHADASSGPTPSEARQIQGVPAGTQYVFVSPSGAEHLQAAGLAAEQRRLDRSNARKYISTSRGSSHAAGSGGSGGGPSSQWECLMGSSAPTGDYVLSGSLSAETAAQSEAADDEQLERTAFVQELLLSMLDLSLTSADLDALSSSSESESEEADAAFNDH